MNVINVSKAIQDRNLIKKVDDLLMVNCNELTEDVLIKFWDETAKQDCIVDIQSFIEGSGSSICRLWIDIGQTGADTWSRFNKEIGVSKRDINQLIKQGIISCNKERPFFDDGTCFIDLDLDALISFLKKVQSDASLEVTLSILLGDREELSETINLVRNNLK